MHLSANTLLTPSFLGSVLNNIFFHGRDFFFFSFLKISCADFSLQLCSLKASPLVDLAGKFQPDALCS